MDGGGEALSYDITLNDPVTKETITIDNPHFMTGGTYAVGGTRELWLNITYNYANYYYEVTEGDLRFAHCDISYGESPDQAEIQYGIRGIYGKTGAESIPMLKDMIARIEEKYKKDGEWINTTRKEWRGVNPETGEIYDDPVKVIMDGLPIRHEEYETIVNEGPNDDYWKETAGNAIRPLYKLIAMAEMRPDGIWDGD